ALDRLWKWAIAHWALLLESDHFWNKWMADRLGIYGDVNDEFSRNARSAIAAKLENCLRQFSERHLEAGTTARSERLHQYELMLLNECRVGRLLLNLNAGLQTNDGTVACGRLMLGMLGDVETVRNRIAHRLNQEKENVELQTLWLQLSKYAHILV